MEHINNSQDEETEFVDAEEEVDNLSPMSFDESLEGMKSAFNLFLNNHFEEAKNRLQKWAKDDMYHALGYAVILHLQASMTREANDIELASQAIKSGLLVIEQKRKKNSLLQQMKDLVKHHNYNSLTTEEVHAELCYAELLCFKAMLIIFQDESFMALVKAGWKIRCSFNTYKECYKILVKRDFKGDSESSKIDFESGVRFGIGVFNVIISLVPTKILKLLEFAGFSGNKRKGLAELEKGINPDNSLRSPLCAITLLAYHTVVSFFTGIGDGNLTLSAELLQKYRSKYPKGVYFLFFTGRLEEVNGRIDSAIEMFEECRDCQDEWTQFKHICYWELMWLHGFKREWTISMKYSEKLSEESKWSKCLYFYQKASFLLMISDKSEDLMNHVASLMKVVPSHKQRLAGKSIPIEKFIVKKSERFFAQDNRLILPAYELMYLWNLFNVLTARPDILKNILGDIEAEMNKLTEDELNGKKGLYKYFDDDYGLLLLLQGVCLRLLNRNEEALKVFKSLQEKETLIKDDSYLVPFSYLETAYIFIKKGQYSLALPLIDEAKHRKSFTLENRLHFRCHSAKSLIDSLKHDSANHVENGLSGIMDLDEEN